MRTGKRARTILALLLSLVMVLGVAPLGALAEPSFEPDKLDPTMKLTSKTDYALAPGITESAIITHNVDGSNQVKSWAVEVDLSVPSTQILASYKDYMSNLGPAAWGMQTVRDQAAKAETYYRTYAPQPDPNFRVVAGVNGDFFNMGNGAPTGTFVMNTKVYNVNEGWPYFAIMKDGTAKIGQGDLDLDEAKEVVGGPGIVIKDGEITDVGLDSSYGVDPLPRTAVGIKADGSVVFLVADGRQAPVSNGQTWKMMSEELLAMGCVDALGLDGGGSTTMLTRREGTSALELANNPSDGVERTVSSAFLICSTAAADGVFDHAVVEPKGEIYTPGSAVTLTATGADASGNPADLPAGEFVLADSDMGSIEGNVFTAADKEGEVKITYVVDGSAKGSTTFEIRTPDSITFLTDEESLGFEEETDFGVGLWYQDRVVHYHDGDIVWSKEYEEVTVEGEGETAVETKAYYPDTENKMGAFTGNKFKSSEDNSINGYVYAASAYDENIKASVYVIIGRLPVMLWDFEDPSEFNFAHSNNGIYEETGSNAIDSSVYPQMVFTYARGAEVEASIVGIDDGEVRFGNHALRLDYDYTRESGAPNNVGTTGWQGNITEGSCFGTTNDIILNVGGVPKQIGAWVYAPEGTPNLWMRARYGFNGNVTQFDFTTQRKDAADGIGGINWTGWKYVTADIPNNGTGEYKLVKGELIRLMALSGGAVGNENGWWTVTGGYETDAQGNIVYNTDEEGNLVPVLAKKKLAQSDIKGTLYFDNIQFIYGTQTDDTDRPEIDKIEVGRAAGDDMKTIIDGTTVNENDVCIQATFHDVENKYSTGMNYNATRVYIDGKDVSEDIIRLDGDGMFKYYPTLANGLHSVKISVRDYFNNEVSETRYFTVEGENEYPTVYVTPDTEEPTLNKNIGLQVTTNKIENVTGLIANLRLNATITKAVSVDFAEGFSGTYNYNAADGTLALEINGAAPAGLTGDGLIATINSTIPWNAPEGAKFRYRVLNGIIGFNDPAITTDTFATADNELDIVADYVITGDDMVVDDWGNLYVKDRAGNPAQGVDVIDLATGSSIGKTNRNGLLTTNAFTGEAQTFKVYAVKDGSYSFPYEDNSVVAGVPGMTGAEPMFVHLNSVADGSTAKNVAWLTNPHEAGDKPVVQYAEKAAYEADGEAAFTELAAECVDYAFKGASGSANYMVRINKAVITGLTPDTDYVYRVGDGTAFSDVFETSTVLDHSDTAFFLIGDLQSEDKTAVNAVFKAIANDDNDYAFGVQTGDAVDNGQIYSWWENVLSTFQNDDIDDIDIIHVMGNHEYYGDETGSAGNNIWNLGEGNARGYSVVYGNVYVAVLNNTYDPAQFQRDVEWLKADSAKATADWKILVVHRAPYGTNAADGSADMRQYFVPVAHECGFDFVFGGDEHSYARTEPMINGQVDPDGVVYYIVGTAGEKGYPVTNRPEYNFVTTASTDDFNALYTAVTADHNEITVTAYNVQDDGSAAILDTYTKTRQTDCSAGHSFEFDGKYLVCSVCGHKRGTEGYTGSAVRAEDGAPVEFVDGVIVSGKWVEKDGEVYYYGENGAVTGEQTIDGFSYTFTEDGKLTVKPVVVLPDGTLNKNVWYNLGDDTYYLGEDGLPVTGEKAITCTNTRSNGQTYTNTYTYTFGEDGRMVKGALVPMSKKYGAKTLNTVKYIIQGVAQRGWQRIDGEWYYFNRLRGNDQDGYPAVNTFRYDDNKNNIHFADKDGYFEIANSDGSVKMKFKFDENAHLVEGAMVESADGTQYMLPVRAGDTNGAGNLEAQKGFYCIKGDVYCFGDDTYMVTGDQNIDGKDYTFASDGKLQMTDDSVTLADGRVVSYDEDGAIIADHIGDHAFEKVVDAAVDATCTETGLTEGRHCAKCDKGAVAQETVPAKGHTPEAIAAVDATCTGTGLTEGSKCAVCGETLTAQETVDALGHTPTVTIEAKAATCTEAGNTEKIVCIVCGAVLQESEEIPATGHTAETLEAVAATCTETGLTDGSKCAVCGEILVPQEEIPAKGHSYTEYTVTKEATCTEAGEKTAYCKDCDKTVTDVIPALGHDYGEWQVAEDGTHYRVCTRDASHVETAAHAWSDPVVTKAATCSAEGEQEYTCVACGEKKTETIAKLAHTVEAIEGKAATCTETGLTAGAKCSVCGEILAEQTVIEALGHEEATAAAKEATCTETGLTEGTYCTRCGEVIKAAEIIPALGHTVERIAGKAATCTEDGMSDGAVCSVCGTVLLPQETVPATGHKFGAWVTVKEPTAKEDGLEERVCALCGEKESRAIAKLDVLIGDVDLDGKVTATDARLALRISAGLEKDVDPRGFAAGDLNGDGKISAAEARKILRVSAKLESF